MAAPAWAQSNSSGLPTFQSTETTEKLPPQSGPATPRTAPRSQIRMTAPHTPTAPGITKPTAPSLGSPHVAQPSRPSSLSSEKQNSAPSKSAGSEAILQTLIGPKGPTPSNAGETPPAAVPAPRTGATAKPQAPPSAAESIVRTLVGPDGPGASEEKKPN